MIATKILEIWWVIKKSTIQIFIMLRSANLFSSSIEWVYTSVCVYIWVIYCTSYTRVIRDIAVLCNLCVCYWNSLRVIYELYELSMSDFKLSMLSTCYLWVIYVLSMCYIMCYDVMLYQCVEWWLYEWYSDEMRGIQSAQMIGAPVLSSDAYHLRANDRWRHLHERFYIGVLY